MKYRLSFIVMTFLVFISWSTGLCETVKGPSVQVPESVFLFDTVPEGTIVMHSYLLKNSGDKVLSIQKVKTG